MVLFQLIFEKSVAADQAPSPPPHPHPPTHIPPFSLSNIENLGRLKMNELKISQTFIECLYFNQTWKSLK